MDGRAVEAGAGMAWMGGAGDVGTMTDAAMAAAATTAEPAASLLPARFRLGSA